MDTQVTTEGTPLAYDPTLGLRDFGYWSHECGAEFYGGGDALHNRGCPVKDYSGCTYHFGPSHVARAKKAAEESGDETTQVVVRGFSLKTLKERFPELV